MSRVKCGVSGLRAFLEVPVETGVLVGIAIVLFRRPWRYERHHLHPSGTILRVFAFMVPAIFLSLLSGLPIPHLALDGAARTPACWPSWKLDRELGFTPYTEQGGGMF